MKNLIRVAAILSMMTALGLPLLVSAQDASKDSKLIDDCNTARAAFIKADSLMHSLFNNASGYVIFPNVGKGAVGVGGAAGNGILFEKGQPSGKASLKQVNIGFQFGGQAYRELIFFQDKAALDRFKQNKVQFSAQVSAVAATAGASANAKYTDGVMVFTQSKGGLMYEAAVGGQKFTYKAY